MLDIKHTKGKWTLKKDSSISNEQGDLIAQICSAGNNDQAKEANAKVIAAAAIGLEVAINTYIVILMTPTEIWRFENQVTYISLREYISSATGYSSKEVQEFYEAVAMDVKHKGSTIECAIERVKSSLSLNEALKEREEQTHWKDRPFVKGDVITFADEKYFVIENKGSSGTVCPIGEAYYANSFHWNFEGEDCKFVRKPTVSEKENLGIV